MRCAHLHQLGGLLYLGPGYAGAWVQVVDLRTGFTLPLGEDGQGNPVFTIYTDASGGYEVYVPTEAAPFVRVVARAPGRADERMTLQALTDAVTALVSRPTIAASPESNDTTS